MFIINLLLFAIIEWQNVCTTNFIIINHIGIVIYIVAGVVDVMVVTIHSTVLIPVGMYVSDATW